MLLDTLFCCKEAGRFLAEDFPNDLVVTHGPRERIGAVAMDSRLCDVSEYCKFYGISGTESAVREAKSLASSDLDALVQTIRQEFGLRQDQINCSMIYTCDGAGTGKHYDQVEGLTIQMCGKKVWRFQERSQLPLPGRMGTDPAAGRMPEDSVAHTLKSGSVSFLPRGWWHDTQALEPAISLHFELHLDCWLNLVLKTVHRMLAGETDYLEPIPMATGEQREQAAAKANSILLAAARRMEEAELWGYSTERPR